MHSSLTPILILLTAITATAEDGLETLLFLKTGPGNPRNSEGDIVELQDGRLCLIYSRFTTGTGDGSEGDLALRTSGDQGKTWSEGRIIVPNEGRNVMSVSLLRLENGELLLFYLRKGADPDKKRIPHSCTLYVRRSADEFKTVSPPVRVTLLNGYHVTNNDRVVQLSTGRLIAPAVLHTGLDATGTKITWDGRHKGLPLAYYSDDLGKTWKKDKTVITPVEKRKLTLQENGVVELQDGRLWMFMRTAHDFQYECYSSDGGETWTTPAPSILASPLSPASVKRLPWTGDLVCIWNDHSGAHPFTKGRRNPLCIAVSKDEGKSWSKSVTIENDREGWYCYTSITFQENRMLLSYNACIFPTWCMNKLKVASLGKSWFKKHFYTP